jgi:hypothetical protein
MHSRCVDWRCKYCHQRGVNILYVRANIESVFRPFLWQIGDHVKYVMASLQAVVWQRGCRKGNMKLWGLWKCEKLVKAGRWPVNWFGCVTTWPAKWLKHITDWPVNWFRYVTTWPVKWFGYVTTWPMNWFGCLTAWPLNWFGCVITWPMN